ncbi:hypothetical protein HPC49_39840 [Pyxidicoccus fallax]|uniref:Uncharacterized protein n=2 Tax=Pyxidicoccus fallax TaxID=394095 RepID=A0A848LC52_9BACT|nr:hypothetical protein [Pyxidicoccus fallax]NPC84351.1 hypothetical protein [Pyxidicoccus fallax]
MATMAVLLVGILAVSLTVLAAARQNRRNLIQAQATLIAEQELERIIGIGCAGPLGQPCSNIQALDNLPRPPVFWAADGELSTTQNANPGRSNRLRFDVAVDVDPGAGGGFEGGARGSPAVDRVEGGAQLQQVINVRVVVSWQDSLLAGLAPATRRAVVLQTRMAP